MTRIYPLMSIVADFTAGPPALPGVSQVSLLPTPQGKGTNVRGWSTTRGRQYELGAVQAGTASLDMVDGSEWLNPVNSGSPFNSGSNSLLPYRCVQIGAWWAPATKSLSGNLLNATNSANIGGAFQPYDPSFETSLAFVGILGGAPTLALSTTQAFAGTHSLAVGFTGATDLPGFGFLTVPGQTYTMSAYVYVPAGVTVTAKFSNFPGALGTTIASATSTVSGAWQRLVMTGVPAGCVGVCSFQQVTGAFPQTVYVDAIQLELSASASAFTTTGPTFYPIYTGYIERYPQTWDMAGFRGLKPLEAVDALSPLSRAAISQSYAPTILSDAPVAYMPLNDAASPQTVQLPQGGQPFIGYTQLGSQSASVNFGGDTAPDGSKAITVVQQNSSPAAVSDSTMLTFQGTRQGNLTMNPQSFAIEAWIKVGSGSPFLGAGTSTNTIGSITGMTFYVGWYSFNGNLGFAFWDPNGTTFFNHNTTTLGSYWWPDGKWHHAVITFIGGNQYQFAWDGMMSTVRTMSPAPSQAINLVNLFIEAQTYYSDPITQVSVANMALYANPLSAAQITSHYQRGIGYRGELPGNRSLRLLTKYWSTNVVTDPGKTALSPDFYYDPPAQPGQVSQAKTVLSALQDIADTEMGLVWADTSGRVHADSRETRYLNQSTSLYTFGENVAGGELPYLAVDYDYDPTYVYSEADLTCDASGNTLVSVNATSQTAYGQRILSKTLYAQNDWDVQQAANFLTQRYAKPAGATGTGVPPRVSKLTLDPASNPNLWQAVLSLDIGSRITVKRRTSAGVTVSGDYYVEHVGHQANALAGTWLVDYEISPVFVSQAWILGDAVKSVLGSTTTCVY